jgi:hypothetical protein
MQRREFLLRSAQVTFAVSAVSVVGGSLVACDGGNGSGTGGDDDCTNGADTEYIPSQGHNHDTVDVSAGDIDTGTLVTRTLLTPGDSGSGNHSHGFDLTAKDFEDLENGLTVTKTSSSSTGTAHTHQVRITC